MRNIIKKQHVIKKEKRYLSTFLISFIFLYALFVPTRIKILASFKVEGIKTTNEMWIIPLIFLILYITKYINTKLLIKSKNSFFVIILYMYILIIVVGGFNAISMSQYIYAALLFLLPILLFFSVSYCDVNDIKFLLKLFVIVCLIYSVFAIILSTRYAFFMDLVGNPIDKYRGYKQYRASMMLGSSIAVSYYFNMTLPICFYVFYESIENKWKIISALSIITNIIATFLFLSRAAVLCMVLIIIFLLFFIKNNKNKVILKTILLIFLMMSIILIIKKYDLSRLSLGFDKSESSIALRLTSGKLGLHIFSKYPILGSGMGRYFERAYTNNYISVDGLIGLVDPHNMYVLILSETGLIGLFIILVMFLTLFIRFLNIKKRMLRQTACMVLFAFLFDAMGGSHLFISMSFSILFWIYMGVFNNVYIRDNINK